MSTPDIADGREPRIKYVRITFPLPRLAKDPNEAIKLLDMEYGINNNDGLFDFCNEDKEIYLTVEELDENMQQDWSWMPEHEARIKQFRESTTPKQEGERA